MAAKYQSTARATEVGQRDRSRPNAKIMAAKYQSTARATEVSQRDRSRPNAKIMAAKYQSSATPHLLSLLHVGLHNYKDQIELLT